MLKSNEFNSKHKIIYSLFFPVDKPNGREIIERHNLQYDLISYRKSYRSPLGPFFCHLSQENHWFSALVIYWILFKISIVKLSCFGGERGKLCTKWSNPAFKIRVKVKTVQNLQCVKWPKNDTKWLQKIKKYEIFRFCQIGRFRPSESAEM